MTKYLRPENIPVASKQLPIEPFIVRPADYYVIDGDTIGVNTSRTDSSGKRLRSFSIRLRSVHAPEKKKQRETASDIILGKLGRKPKSYDPGSFSKSMASILLKGRCILIIPGEDRKRDDHGRLLGDVFVSGSHGKEFKFQDAFSLERILVEDNLVTPDSNEALPDLRPPAYLETFRRDRKARNFEFPAPSYASPHP